MLVIDANPVPLCQDPDGVLRVGETRVTLDTIIAAHQRGESPEAIADQYPAVSVLEVYAVVGYYLRRREEVEAYLADRNRRREELRRADEARFPSNGLRQRLASQLESSP